MKSQLTSKTVEAKKVQPYLLSKTSRISAWNLDLTKSVIQHSLLSTFQSSPSIRPTQCKKSYLAYGSDGNNNDYQSNREDQNQYLKNFSIGNHNTRNLLDGKMKTEQSQPQSWQQNESSFALSLKKTQSEKYEVSQLILSLSQDKKFKVNVHELPMSQVVREDKGQLQIQINALQQELSNSRILNEKLKKQIKDLELIREQNNKDNQNSDLQIDQEKLKKNIKDLEQQLKDLNSKNSQNSEISAKEIERLKKMIKDLEQQLKELNNTNNLSSDGLAKENEKLRKNIKDLEQQLKDSNNTNNQESERLRKIIKDLEQQLKDQNNKNSQGSSLSDKETEKLKQAIKDLQSQLQQEQKEKSSTREETQRNELFFKNEIENWKLKFADLKTKSDFEVKEIAKLNAVIDELEAQIQKGLKSNNDSENIESVTYQKNEVEVWKKKFVELNRQYFTLKESQMLLEAENHSLVSQQKQNQSVRQSTTRQSKGPESANLRQSKGPDAT